MRGQDGSSTRGIFRLRVCTSERRRRLQSSQLASMENSGGAARCRRIWLRSGVLPPCPWENICRLPAEEKKSAQIEESFRKLLAALSSMLYFGFMATRSEKKPSPKKNPLRQNREQQNPQRRLSRMQLDGPKRVAAILAKLDEAYQVRLVN